MPSYFLWWICCIIFSFVVLIWASTHGTCRARTYTSRTTTFIGFTLLALLLCCDITVRLGTDCTQALRRWRLSSNRNPGEITGMWYLSTYDSRGWARWQCPSNLYDLKLWVLLQLLWISVSLTTRCKNNKSKCGESTI